MTATLLTPALRAVRTASVAYAPAVLAPSTPPASAAAPLSPAAITVAEYLLCVLEGRPYPSAPSRPDAAMPPCDCAEEGLTYVVQGRAFARAD
jgi:hypothetical protein